MTDRNAAQQPDSIHGILTAIKALLPGVEDDDILPLEVLSRHSEDPVVLATLIAALIEERRKTNTLLEEIRQSLRALEERISAASTNAPAPATHAPPSPSRASGAATSAPPSPAPELFDLSEADERILALIHEHGMVSAADVKEALGYKGLNAASARLNALYKRGILRKIRKGRKVYFTLADRP